MINANELRIGNWVKIEGTSTYCTQLKGRDILDLESGDFVKAGIEIHPIPLTPEILEACGFEYEHGQIEMYRNNNIWMYWDGKSLSANFGHIEQLDVEISTLHQLQNLYFALTKKELIYQP